MGTSLDLSKVFDRDDVKLRDGKTVELRNPQEFGILDDHRLRTLIERIDSFDKETKDEAEAEQASGMLRELAAMIVVECPEDLDDWECVAIFQFWMARAREQAGVGDASPRKPRTTAASSRGSRSSTAATPRRGSRSRRTS